MKLTKPLLCLALALSLVACGEEEEPAASPTPAPTAAPTASPAASPEAAAPAADQAMDPADLMALLQNGQWGGVGPDGTAYLVTLADGTATLESQAPDADTTTLLAETDLTEIDWSDLENLELDGHDCSLVQSGDTYYLQVDGVTLTPRDVQTDPEQALTDLAEASGILDQFGPDKFWLACLDDSVYVLQIDGETIHVTYYQLDGEDNITRTDLSGTPALDENSLSVIDADGKPLLAFTWTMLNEGGDGLPRFDVEQNLTTGDLPEQDDITFYMTQLTSAEDADEMARSYLENRQEPDPETDDLTTLLEGYHGVSIVDACIMHGIDPSLENRAVYAEAFGIENYRGTAEQNLFLLTSMGGVVE